MKGQPGAFKLLPWHDQVSYPLWIHVGSLNLHLQEADSGVKLVTLDFILKQGSPKSEIIFTQFYSSLILDMDYSVILFCFLWTCPTICYLDIYFCFHALSSLLIKLQHNFTFVELVWCLAALYILFKFGYIRIIIFCNISVFWVMLAYRIFLCSLCFLLIDSLYKI